MIHYLQGPHKVRVTAQIFGTNANNKTCLAFELQPLEFLGNSADADPVAIPEDSPKRSISLYFMTPENCRISVEELRRLGWTGISFTDFIANPPKWSLIDQEVIVECIHETYEKRNGDTGETEKWRFPSNLTLGDRVKTADIAAARKLDAQFATILKARSVPRAAQPNGNGTSTKPARSPVPPPVEPDEPQQYDEPQYDESAPF